MTSTNGELGQPGEIAYSYAVGKVTQNGFLPVDTVGPKGLPASGSQIDVPIWVNNTDAGNLDRRLNSHPSSSDRSFAFLRVFYWGVLVLGIAMVFFNYRQGQRIGFRTNSYDDAQ